jgi:hypothetical protein
MIRFTISFRLQTDMAVFGDDARKESMILELARMHGLERIGSGAGMGQRDLEFSAPNKAALGDMAADMAEADFATAFTIYGKREAA